MREVESFTGRGEGAFRRQGLHESQVTHLHGLRQTLPALFPVGENRLDEARVSESTPEVIALPPALNTKNPPIGSAASFPVGA